MQLGSLVIHKGRPYYLRGLDPMSVSDRQAELEDAFTGARVTVPLDEVGERGPPNQGPRVTRGPWANLKRRAPLAAMGLFRVRFEPGGAPPLGLFEAAGAG